MNSKGISNTKEMGEKAIQNFDKHNLIQNGKQHLQIDISSLQKNNYIHQQNNHFNLSLDIGAGESTAPIKSQAKQYQTSLNRSYLEGDGYNSHNDSSIIIGRKIENQNNLVISGNSTTQNQNIRKFPIPVDLMKTKKKNRSSSRGRVSKLSNQDESGFLDTNDNDIIQTEQNYLSSQHNQSQGFKDIQRQLYYQSSMRSNNISSNEYDDAEDIIQMSSIIPKQKDIAILNNMQQKQKNIINTGIKSMKAVSSGSTNIQNRSISPQSNNTNISTKIQVIPADNSTASFGKKKIKRVGGVLKVVKKSLTPKKKTKSKDITIKGAQKKEQNQNNSSYLFQNKVIQDASYALHNNDEDFDDQFEFNTEKEFSEKCENTSNAAINYQTNIPFEIEGQLWNKQHEEYVRIMQNITNQEDIMNNKNSGRQTTFSFRGKGRSSQTPSSRQKKKKRSSSRNQEQPKIVKHNKSRSKSGSKSHQRALSSQGMQREGKNGSASKSSVHQYNAEQVKKIKVGQEFKNPRCTSQNENKKKNSPSKKNHIMNEDKKEEIFKKRFEEEENQKKEMKKKEIIQKNSEIRQKNAQKVNMVKRVSDQTFPWGMNQKKFKQQQERSRERSVKEFSPSKSRSEKERREEMGLQFLNSMSQDEIDKLIQNHKIWYNQLMEQNKENKKELSYEEQQKIHFFMQLQKKQKKRLAEENEELQRKKNVKKNLEDLDHSVREQRSKSSQRHRPTSNNQPNTQSNVSNINIKKDYSSGNIQVQDSFYQSENENFEDKNFDFIQSQYKKLIQIEKENQSINDKSMSFNLTNNSNNRSFQINYDSKKSINNTSAIINANNNNISINNENTSKSNSLLKPILNQPKLQSKTTTTHQSKGHSRNNSNLNSSVLNAAGTHKRSLSRGAAQTKNSDNQNNISFVNQQIDQNNSIDYLQEKKRQLKLQYSLISDRLKRQREDKKILKQQKQIHNQSFAHGEENSFHLNNLDKFTDHNFSVNIHNQQQLINLNQQQISNMSVSNKNLQEIAENKQKIVRPASSQYKQIPNDSNQIRSIKAKDLNLSKASGFPQHRHSDVVAASGGSSRQSNYHSSNTPTPSSNVGFSRPQSKQSDKKSKKKTQNTKNSSFNNISINKSDKKKKKSKGNNINISKQQLEDKNMLQVDKSPERTSVSNTISINNNFSYNINFEMLQQLKQQLSSEQISNLTQEQLHDFELSFLQQQHKQQMFQKAQFTDKNVKNQYRHQQGQQVDEQVDEEDDYDEDDKEDDENDEGQDDREYDDNRDDDDNNRDYDGEEVEDQDNLEEYDYSDGSQQPYYIQNKFPPHQYQLNTSQNQLKQLYENYDEEMDIDPKEMVEDDINYNLDQTNQMLNQQKSMHGQQQHQYVNQQQLSQHDWENYQRNQMKERQMNPQAQQNQVYCFDEKTQQYYYQNIPQDIHPSKIKGQVSQPHYNNQALHPSQITRQTDEYMYNQDAEHIQQEGYIHQDQDEEEEEIEEGEYPEDYNYDHESPYSTHEDGENKQMDEDEDDEEIEDQCNAHNHSDHLNQGEEVQKVDQGMNSNVDEPFEIEVLDTSNFTEKGYYGTLHSTINDDDKKSQQSSQSSSNNVNQDKQKIDVKEGKENNGGENQKNLNNLKLDDIGKGLKRSKKDLKKEKIDTENKEEELNISEMRRIEKQYQELLSKQPHQEKYTTFKTRMSLNNSLIDKKAESGKNQSQKQPLSSTNKGRTVEEEEITSDKKEAARVIIKCLKELRTQRVVRHAFNRYMFGTGDIEDYNHIDHDDQEYGDELSDQLNEGMQIYTERNDSDTQRNLNDARINLINLQTSYKNIKKSKDNEVTPKSVNNQTYNNTENIKNMKEIASSAINKRNEDYDDEDEINFNKMLLGHSANVNSKANRAIDDYSLDDDDDIISKSSAIQTAAKNIKLQEHSQNKPNDDIIQDLSIEEVPFSKYGFIKQQQKQDNYKNLIAVDTSQQPQSNVRGSGSIKQQIPNNQQQLIINQEKNTKNNYNQQQNEEEEDDDFDEGQDIEIKDEFEFDQILYDLHQQALKNQQITKQDKQQITNKDNQEIEEKADKSLNQQKQQLNNNLLPQQKPQIGNKFNLIEKIIHTNSTDEDNKNYQLQQKQNKNEQYQHNKSSECDENENNKVIVNDDEEEEYQHLNKNKYQSEMKREYDSNQIDESSADKDSEREIFYRQQQRNAMQSRYQNYQEDANAHNNQLNDSDLDSYAQQSFESSDHQRSSQYESYSQRSNLQKYQINNQNNKFIENNNVNNQFDDYLDQSISENKVQTSQQSSKLLSKPNSEELIELLAKQQFKKVQQQQPVAESQVQNSKYNSQIEANSRQNQAIKNGMKKKPQLNLSIKSNENNYDQYEDTFQDNEQPDNKNGNSKPSQKQKANVEENLIRVLGINDEWSNQKKKTNEKNLYETDMQVMGGSSNEIFDNQINQHGSYQRHNFLMTSGALDTQKLNNLIAGGHQRYQMSSEDKKYVNEDDDENNSEGDVQELITISDPHQINNTLQFKEINEHQRSLVTVKEFDKTDFSDMSKGMTSNFQNSTTNNKKRRDKSSTEFLREKLTDELNKIEAIPEISNTFISENSENQSAYSSVNHSRQSSHQNKSNLNRNKQSNQDSQSKSHSSSVNTTQKSMIQQQYEQELNKIKEEEALKWNHMINILNSLQNKGSIPKEAAEQMKLFSEMNKKQLEVIQNHSRNNSELKDSDYSCENSFLFQSSNKKAQNQRQQQAQVTTSQVDEIEEKLITIESNNSQKYGAKQDNQNNQRQKKESPFKFDLPQSYEKQTESNQTNSQSKPKEEIIKGTTQSGDKGQKQQRKKDLKIDVDKITESYYRNENNSMYIQDAEEEKQDNNNNDQGDNTNKQNTNNSNQMTTNSNQNNLSRNNNNNNSEDKIRFEEDFMSANNNNSSSNATNTQKNLTSGSDQFNKNKPSSTNIGQFLTSVDKNTKGNKVSKIKSLYDDEEEIQDKQNVRGKENSGVDEQSLSSCTSPSVTQSMVQKHLMRVHTNSTDGEDSVRGSNDHQVRSIFEINTFGEQFDDHKMKEILQMDKIDDIFDVAKQALNVRKETKSIKLQNMFDKQRISPKSFYHKQQELEKWVSKEQQSIERTKQRMQKTILSTEQTIKKTQRDIEFSKQMKNKKAVLSSSSYKNLLQNQDFDILRVSLSEEDDNLSSASSSQRYYHHHHHHPHPQSLHDQNTVIQNNDKLRNNKKQHQHDILVASCTPDSQSSNNIKVIDDFDCSSSYDQQNQHIFAQLKQKNAATNQKKQSNNLPQNQLPHTGAAQSLANSSGSSGNNLSVNNDNHQAIKSNSINNDININNTSSSSSLRKLTKDKSQHQLQNIEDASNEVSKHSSKNNTSILSSKDSHDIRQLTEEERKNLQFEKKRVPSGSSNCSSKRNNNSSPLYENQFQEDDFDSFHSSIQQSSHNSLQSHTDRNNIGVQLQLQNIKMNDKNQENGNNQKSRLSQQDADIKYIDETSKNFLNSISNSSDLIQQRKGSLNRSGSHHQYSQQQTSSIETIEEHELPQTDKAIQNNPTSLTVPQQLSAAPIASTNIQNRNSSDKKKAYLQSSEKSSIADPRSVEKTLSKQSEDQEVDISGDEDLHQSIEWEDDLPQPKRGGVTPQRAQKTNQDDLIEENFDGDFLGDHNRGNFYQKAIKQYSVQQNPSMISVQSVSNNNSTICAAPLNNISSIAAPLNNNNNNSNVHNNNSQNFLKLSNAKSDRSDLIYSTSKEVDNISEIYLTAEKDNHSSKLQEIAEVSDDMILLNNNPSHDLNFHEMELLDESASQLYQDNYQRRNRSDSDPSVHNNILSGGDFIVPDQQKGVNGGFIKLSNLINQYNPGDSLSKAPLQKVSPQQSEVGSNENLPVVQTQSQCLRIEDQMNENEPKQLGNNNKSHYINKFEINQEDNDENDVEDEEDDHNIAMSGINVGLNNNKTSQLNQGQQKHLQEESLNEQQNKYIMQQKNKEQKDEEEEEVQINKSEKEAESIVSFIMNDLLRESIEEIHNIQMKKSGQNQVQPQGDVNQKNNQQIVQANQRNVQRQFKPQGFKTNLNYVKEYIFNVSTHIQNDNDYKTKFLMHINTWLGPQPEELLKLLHMYDGSQDEQLDTSDESSYSTQPILDGKLYADIERKRNVQPSQDNRDNLIKTLERIHNKAIFEAFNEALDYERMYGLRGKPFPWKITHEKISEKPHSQQNIPKILQDAGQKVIEWSSSLCGIIVDKEDSHFQPGINLDEDYLQQIKEDRLNHMLSAEVIENEEKWILYDEEQTEVQVELSQMVFDLLIYEACNEFRKISLNQAQNLSITNNSSSEVSNQQ